MFLIGSNRRLLPLKTRRRTPISTHGMRPLSMPPTATPESARLAASLLRTMERGDVTSLEAALDRVEGVWRHRAAFSSQNPERLELLSAVAGDLRRSMVRLQKRRADHLEGAEVHLYLLRHLAYDPL